jgi:aldehyde dehydrogenase (NAD+)
MVSFTGSCTVGAKVAEQAAPTLKRLVLELGGKSAAIFLPDSAERAAAHGLQVCTAHAGQGCVLGTRVFVPEEKKAGSARSHGRCRGQCEDRPMPAIPQPSSAR